MYRKDMWSNAAMLLDYHSVNFNYTKVIRLCDRFMLAMDSKGFSITL